MKVSGKELAEDILKKINSDILLLKDGGVTPKIAILTLGSEEAWNTYVGQKIKLAKRLGLKSTLINIGHPNEEELVDCIDKLNHNDNVTGIIVQRPMPSSISIDKIISAIDPDKDIDGFRKDSKFGVPSFLAVKRILSYIATKQNSGLKKWLSEKRIVVIGKGETAGMPAIKGLRSLGINPQIIDSKTRDKKDILKKADIIISAVGKKVIEKEGIKKDVILIGIGINKSNGKLKGDYDEDEIKKVASFYTSTPGGVGPLNLAYLFKNLIDAGKSAT